MNKKQKRAIIKEACKNAVIKYILLPIITNKPGHI